MSGKSKGLKRHAILVALNIQPGRPVSAWPDNAGFGDDDEDDDWIVGLAKHDFEGPYYAVTADHIEIGVNPYVYQEIARVRGRRGAEALAAHLNALSGGAA